jgi:hypothetical protein
LPGGAAAIACYEIGGSSGTEDREAILGDLAESGATLREASWQVAAILVRRNWATWIISMAAAVWITLSITTLALGCHTWFFVLRNYRDFDPAVLAETGYTWLDIVRHFASSAWLPAVGSVIAGFVLARRSRQAKPLSVVLFLAASAVAMIWRSFAFRWYINPTPASAIFVESTLIWIPLIIGIRLRRTA